jgi:hypothetical protein
LGDTDALFIGSCNWVVKTNALNEATIAAGSLVSHNDIEKRASFSTTTSESNDDHDLSFGRLKLLSAYIFKVRFKV